MPWVVINTEDTTPGHELQITGNQWSNREIPPMLASFNASPLDS